MASATPEFSSRIGFILAAAGSAVGLGNIWGFPTQAASNGGGAFVLVYLLMVLTLAYPMLVAELSIGQMQRQSPINSLKALSDKPFWKRTGVVTGFLGLCALSLILSFYAIVAGWLIAFWFAPLAEFIGMAPLANWLTSFSIERNAALMLVFMFGTILVVRKGVSEGIENLSKKLMPALFVLMIALTLYMFTQEGASEGLAHFLIPDFNKVTDSSVWISAMGQAFFSLSLGIGTMMAYGAYLPKTTNLPKAAGWVALLDTGVAMLAGLLIIPAMFVAQHHGVEIYDAEGALKSSDTLVFDVLPSLFHSMGAVGPAVAFAFFALMVIAAITSSISMLEAPVQSACEAWQKPRSQMSWILGLVITAISLVIVLNFGALFGLVITITTVYAQPLLGLAFAVLLMWVSRREKLYQSLKAGNPELDNSLFWKVWPNYVKFVCPILMGIVLIQQF